MRTVTYSGPGVFIWIATIVFGVYIAIDASKYPEWAFQQAGTQKWLYQILAPIGGFCCGIFAIVIGIIWLASKKAEVERAARGGGAPGGYGTGYPPPGGPPPWGPPPAGPSSPPPPGPWSPPPPPPTEPPGGVS